MGRCSGSFGVWGFGWYGSCLWFLTVTAATAVLLRRGGEKTVHSSLRMTSEFRPSCLTPGLGLRFCHCVETVRRGRRPGSSCPSFPRRGEEERVDWPTSVGSDLVGLAVGTPSRWHVKCASTAPYRCCVCTLSWGMYDNFFPFFVFWHRCDEIYDVRCVKHPVPSCDPPAPPSSPGSFRSRPSSDGRVETLMSSTKIPTAPVRGRGGDWCRGGPKSTWAVTPSTPPSADTRPTRATAYGRHTASRTDTGDFSFVCPVTCSRCRTARGLRPGHLAESPWTCLRGGPLR